VTPAAIDVETALRTVCREQCEHMRRALFDSGCFDEEIDAFVTRSRQVVERKIPCAIDAVRQAVGELAELG